MSVPHITEEVSQMEDVIRKFLLNATVGKLVASAVGRRMPFVQDRTIVPFR